MIKRLLLVCSLLLPVLAEAQIQVKLADTSIKVPVMAISASDHVSRKTDVSSLTCSRSKNGTVAACEGTSAEASDANQPGLWAYTLAAGDVDTAGALILTFSATGMDTFSTALQVGGVSVAANGISSTAMAAEGTAVSVDASKMWVQLAASAPYGNASLDGNNALYINSATTGAGQTACICSYTSADQKANFCVALPVALTGTVTYTVIPSPNCSGILLANKDVVSGYNATLKLKQLDISNSGGHAISAVSTGSNGSGFNLLGQGSGHGINSVGGATAGTYGIRAAGGSGGGGGMRLVGTVDYPGQYVSGNGLGAAAQFDAGATSPNAILYKCIGGNCDAFKLTPYGTGTALSGALSAANLSAAAANKVADHVIRRNTSNVEASSDGDTLVRKSIYGATAQQTHKIKNEGGYQKVYKADGLTLFGSRALTTQAGAAPIVEIGD